VRCVRAGVEVPVWEFLAEANVESRLTAGLAIGAGQPLPATNPFFELRPLSFIARAHRGASVESGAPDSFHGDARSGGIERGGYSEDSPMAPAGCEMSRVMERRGVWSREITDSRVGTWGTSGVTNPAAQFREPEREEGGMPESLQSIAACAPSSVPRRAFAA
jgi:hypothetical protein